MSESISCNFARCVWNVHKKGSPKRHRLIMQFSFELDFDMTTELDFDRHNGKKRDSFELDFDMTNEVYFDGRNGKKSEFDFDMTRTRVWLPVRARVLALLPAGRPARRTRVCTQKWPSFKFVEPCWKYRTGEAARASCFV